MNLTDYILSEKGKDWKGNKLNEDTLPRNALVVWRNKLYVTGNRKNEMVELFSHKFIRTVIMKYIYLAKKK